VLTITGNTWTLAGKLVTAGKQYQVKGTFELAPDLASAAFKSEISVDGETWTPFRESRYTKVPPAAKK
jgi:outer membrane lipoprotein-sorting protein